MAIRTAITARPDFCWKAICCKPPRLINCMGGGDGEGRRGREKKKKKIFGQQFSSCRGVNLEQIP